MAEFSFWVSEGLNREIRRHKSVHWEHVLERAFVRELQRLHFYPGLLESQFKGLDGIESVPRLPRRKLAKSH
jgi:hypothetical protein